MNPAPAPVPVEIDTRAAVRALATGLVGVQAALLVLDFLFAYLDLLPFKVVQHLANLAREDGLGTWFGATQATAAGLVLAAIGLAERRSGRAAWGWWILAAGFVYIGADDALGIHERLGSAAKSLTRSPLFDLFPTYAWQLVFGPIFGGLALFMIGFTWTRLGPTLRRGLYGALACFVVAVGFDFVEGVDGAFSAIADALGVRDYTVSHACKVTEEILEMLGTTAFLAVFAARLGESVSGWRITVRPVDGTPPLG